MITYLYLHMSACYTLRMLLSPPIHICTTLSLCFYEPPSGQVIQFHSISCVLRHIQYVSAQKCVGVHVSRVCRSVWGAAGCHGLRATTDPSHLLPVTGIKEIQLQCLICETMGNSRKGGNCYCSL